MPYKDIVLNQKIKELLLYLKCNVEFYSDKLPRLEEISATKNIFTIFNKLNIVDKKTIKQNMGIFVSKEISTNSLFDKIVNFDEMCFAQEDAFDFGDTKIFSEHTSGTSGIPFTVLKTANERVTLGKQIWKIRNNFEKVKPFDMYDFSISIPITACKMNFEDEVHFLLNYLKDSNFSWWYINENALNKIVPFVKEKSIDFKHLKVIENSGSHIFKEQIEEFERIFKCKISNNYACREVWSIAYTCKYGHLHINDNVYVELVNDNNELITNAQVRGNVVVTSLDLRAMPFVRYLVGDQACWVEGNCNCGNKSKRIELLPQRQKISGTNLYGNLVFQSVITRLLTQYNLIKYSEINITQTSLDRFNVNIKGCRENKRFMEKAFLATANSLLNDKHYFYDFSYDENMIFKSIFSSMV